MAVCVLLSLKPPAPSNPLSCRSLASRSPPVAPASPGRSDLIYLPYSFSTRSRGKGVGEAGGRKVVQVVLCLPPSPSHWAPPTPETPLLPLSLTPLCVLDFPDLASLCAYGPRLTSPALSLRRRCPVLPALPRSLRGLPHLLSIICDSYIVLMPPPAWRGGSCGCGAPRPSPHSAPAVMAFPHVALHTCWAHGTPHLPRVHAPLPLGSTHVITAHQSVDALPNTHRVAAGSACVDGRTEPGAAAVASTRLLSLPCRTGSVAGCGEGRVWRAQVGGRMPAGVSDTECSGRCCACAPSRFPLCRAGRGKGWGKGRWRSKFCFPGRAPALQGLHAPTKDPQRRRQNALTEDPRRHRLHALTKDPQRRLLHVHRTMGCTPGLALDACLSCFICSIDHGLFCLPRPALALCMQAPESSHLSVARRSHHSVLMVTPPCCSPLSLHTAAFGAVGSDCCTRCL
mmetsp:Transcript_26944/g.79941  ORF Transcript_26944/g.79941 Transcript_26944/m.79941 type:complete len:455 (-) Transcript_26944:52-1416(-)